MTTRQTMILPWACALALAGFACTDDVGTEAESTTTESDSGDGDGDPTGDGDGDPTGDGDGDPTGDGDGDPAECGNGEVDAGEQCDDGNEVDTDFCTNACTNPCAPVWDTREVDTVTGNSLFVGELAIDQNGELIVGSQRTNADVEDAFVARYNATGDAQMWEVAHPSMMGSSAITGLALGDDGDIYVAGLRDGMDGEDLWVARVSGADGALIWEAEYDGMFDGSDDGATDIALASDGVVVVGTVMDVDQDSDIFVQKLDWDGAELWNTTYSGVLAGNGFGLDRGGDVAVDDDGTIYVTGHIYVDFETVDLALLSYAADGTGPDWEMMPTAGGSGYDYASEALRLDGAGNLYVAMTDVDSPINTFKINKYATADGSEVWSIGNAEVAPNEDPENWLIADLRADASGFVLLGSWFNQEYLDSGLTRREIYAGHFDAEGNPLCFGGFGEVAGGDMPHAAISASVVWTDARDPIGLGAVFKEGTIDLWLAQFGTP